MEIEEIAFCEDNCGTEYIVFREHPTKTRQVELNTKRRTVFPKMFDTGGPRRPVQFFK